MIGWGMRFMYKTLDKGISISGVRTVGSRLCVGVYMLGWLFLRYAAVQHRARDECSRAGQRISRVRLVKAVLIQAIAQTVRSGTSSYV